MKPTNLFCAFAVVILVIGGTAVFASSATLRWNDAAVHQVTAVPSGLDIEVEAGGATQVFRCLETSLYFHYCQAVQVGDRLYLVGRPTPGDRDEPYVQLVELSLDLEETVKPPSGGGGDRDGD